MHRLADRCPWLRWLFRWVIVEEDVRSRVTYSRQPVWLRDIDESYLVSLCRWEAIQEHTRYGSLNITLSIVRS